MNNVFTGAGDQHEFNTKHSTTFAYQKGYDDAIMDTDNAQETLWMSLIFMSLIWMLVLLRFLRPRAFTHPYQ